MSSSFPDQPPAFPAVPYATWRAEVERVLGDTAFETLRTRTEDGLVIEPLYTAGDGGTGGMPGPAPFTRGRSGGMGWQLRVAVSGSTVAEANRVVLDELRGGASAVLLVLHGPNTADGRQGIPVHTGADLDALLEGVHPEMIAIALDAGGGFLPAAAALVDLWTQRAIPADQRSGELGGDPLGSLARDGRLSTSVDDALAQLGDLAAWAVAEEAIHPAARVSTAAYHAAGCTPAQELAIAAATGVAYLRAMEAAGVAAASGARQLVFDLAIGTEQFQEIAKLRAFRLLWSRVLELCGVTGAPLSLTTQLARRVITVRDPWVNMLRGTVACFAAAIGGADAITVHPFDLAAGAPGPLGRRVARNTQLVLHEESHIDLPADPAGGSYFVEALTAALAERAWGELQEIERAGGMAAALTSGWVAARIEAAHESRARAIARRTRAITGVSEFPNLTEPALPVGGPRDAVRATDAAAPRGGEGARLEAVRASSLPDAGAEPGSRTRAAIRAVGAGAPLADVALALAAGRAPTTIDPLPIRPLAEPFEALRSASDAWLARTGARPRALLVTIGPVAHHAARAGFARNALEAGGIETTESGIVTEASSAMAAFGASGAGIAVLASSDALYAEHAAAIATALRDAGARTVLYAGRPGDREAALREAGVNLFMHAGMDVVALLHELLQREGVTV